MHATKVDIFLLLACMIMIHVAYRPFICFDRVLITHQHFGIANNIRGTGSETGIVTIRSHFSYHSAGDWLARWSTTSIHVQKKLVLLGTRLALYRGKYAD